MLRVVECTPGPVRVRGDFASQSGAHTFAWEGADGSTAEIRLRFSFMFKRDCDARGSGPGGGKFSIRGGRGRTDPGSPLTTHR